MDSLLTQLTFNKITVVTFSVELQIAVMLIFGVKVCENQFASEQRS